MKFLEGLLASHFGSQDMCPQRYIRKGTSFLFWTVEYMILKVKGFESIQNTQTMGLIMHF